MEKTINCEECKVEFTFEENPKFPRKYCLNCSAKKKKDFADGIEREPVKVFDKDGGITPEQAEKQRVYDKHKVGTHVEKPRLSDTIAKGINKSNGFKLTEENIRIGALDCALKMSALGEPKFWDYVERFEKYIRFGE